MLLDQNRNVLIFGEVDSCSGVAEQPESWEFRVFVLSSFFFFHKAFVSSIENLHKSTTDLVNNRLLKISPVSSSSSQRRQVLGNCAVELRDWEVSRRQHWVSLTVVHAS